MYSVEINHSGLNKYRIIRDRDIDVLERKADVQTAKWNEAWEKRCEREAIEAAREASESEAGQRTREAQQAILDLEGLLSHTLTVDDTVNWDSLKDRSDFGDRKPVKRAKKTEPIEPQISDLLYRVELGLLDRLIKSRRERKEQEAAASFETDRLTWEQDCARVSEQNLTTESKYKKNIADWEKAQSEFLAKQHATNELVDLRRREYEQSNPQSVVDYCELVLSNSEYPPYFPQDSECDYNPSTRILVVDFTLPGPDDLPSSKEFKYVKSKDEIRESVISDSAKRKLYDGVMYQVTLRTIHELFEADTVGALDAIVFNGWVQGIDPATGQSIKPCILSLQAGKAEFEAISLDGVDPKFCFKKLRGVGSAKLHAMVPIAPLIVISREDDRFVPGHGVIEDLDAGANLAAMDWEDFEHLIREVFEKEFAAGGGEVKITRASRDHGVDAIAFDPDPIRGGKIVIQAKRYTNTVGVSAVRDLYGTVMNEGATKGILVTTADYGPDAYEFARDKPLTLLNGGNLLHLLAKHGHRARIDLAEAREQRSDP